MDNLDDINTVQDLMKVQTFKPCSTKELVEDLVTPIYCETPAIGLDCLEHLLTSMIELHKEMVETMSDENTAPVDVACWASDLTKLQIAYDLVTDIKL
jgi:hypothetical protein